MSFERGVENQTCFPDSCSLLLVFTTHFFGGATHQKEGIEGKMSVEDTALGYCISQGTLGSICHTSMEQSSQNQHPCHLGSIRSYASLGIAGAFVTAKPLTV